MRKIRQFFLTTAVLIASTAVTMAAYNGTPVRPTMINESNYSSTYHLTADYISYYAITSAAELYGFAEIVNKRGNLEAKAVLLSDIVVNEGDITQGYKWTPLGCIRNNYGTKVYCPYEGVFDGNGHTISGLNIYQYSSDGTPFTLSVTVVSDYEPHVYSYSGDMNMGFLGLANGATVKNLGIINSRSAGSSSIGGFCGYTFSTLEEDYYIGPTTITNCFFEGGVSGYSYVGGICGCGRNVIINNCYYKGTAYYADNTNYKGGICGRYGTMTDCVYLYPSNIMSTVTISGGNGAINNCKKLQDDNALASGRLCYLLNGSTSEGDLFWHQNLTGANADPRPVMDKTHGTVYYSSPCHSYNNNSSSLDHNFSNKICTRCGYTQGLEMVTDAAHAAELGLPASFVDWSIISTVDELYQYAALVKDGTIGVRAVLVNDITVNTNVLDANGNLNGDGSNFRAWTPIDCKDTYSWTEFDGNGHIISGLYYNNDTRSYVGLFGYGISANISNVGVVDSYFSGKRHVGGIAGLCGWDYKKSYIKNCYFTGTVIGTGGCVGGICGEAYCFQSGSKQAAKTYIQNCYNTGKVIGGTESDILYQGVGGICGHNGFIENCYNTGTVTGTGSYVGGICGCWRGEGKYGSQTNNWYLTGCATDGGGKVQNGMGYQTKGYAASDNLTKTAPATTAQFASGEVAYKLNGSKSTGDIAWYQNIDANADPLPVLDATHGVVWNATTICPRYANSEISTHLYNADGVCVCGDVLTLTEIDGVYQIGHQKQLYMFAQLVNNGTTDANAVLTADIVVNTDVLKVDGTLNGNGNNFKAWTPIGNSSNIYSGTFDGQGHSISGLYANIDNNYVGLFGYCSGAIKNVGVIDSYLQGRWYCGGISGSGGIITNCYNTGTVYSSSGNYLGGICGYYGTQTNCYNTGKVSGYLYIGGICGTGGTQTNCYNRGKVTGSQYNSYGGICGTGGTQINCYHLRSSCLTSGGGNFVNAENFASGEVGYKLNNNGANTVWRQNLSADALPSLDTCKNPATGYITADGDNYTVVGNMYLATNYEVAEGKTLTVPEGASLTTTGTAVVSNNGTIVCDGTMDGNDLDGNGIFKYNQFNGDDIAFTPSTYTYKGSAYEIGNGLIVSVSPRIMCGKSFTFTGTAPTATRYENNTYAGTAYVVFDYSVQKTFTIKPLEVTLNWSETALTYTGAAQAPSATVGNLLGSDVCGVTVEGAQTNVGGPYTATATALSNTNYKLPEDATTEFSISSKAVSTPVIVLSATSFTYNGQAQTPTVTVKDDQTTIDPLEYTVTMTADVTNVGQKAVTISDNEGGNYNVSGSTNFTINAKTVSNPTIELSATSFTYNGSAQTPIVTVKDGETNIPSSEYTVTMTEDVTNAGVKTVTICDNEGGNYNVNGSTTFSITPMTGVVVTITENSSEVVYNTEEQMVSGYTFGINDILGIYSEEDFTFSGNAVAAGTTVGTYPMGLSADDFSNTNENYADVEFVIVDGALTINKAPEAPNKPETTIETRFINTQLVTLPENWQWTEFKDLELGANTATAKYAGTDAGNYVLESIDIAITRIECQHNAGTDILYVVAATCTEAGYSGNLSCKLCGKIYEMGDSIPALGHDFVNTVIAPTCTTEGYTEHLCNRCQHIEYSDTVAATGHKADSVVFENVVAATCTEAGSRDSVVYCSVCRVELSRDVVDVPAAGHKADSVQFENIVAATCTVAGSKDSVVYCTVCKAELSRTKIEIPATGHKADSIQFENVVAATCTVAGSKDSVVYCSVCGVEVSRTKIEIPATGHTVVVDSAVAATATETGLTEGSHCSVCGETIVAQEVIPATGEQGGEGNGSEGGNENQGGNENTEPATAVAESAAQQVSIYSHHNIIVVENADAEIFVYNIMGNLVATTNDANAEIVINTTGVYIVKVGGTSKRVMINN